MMNESVKETANRLLAENHFNSETGVYKESVKAVVDEIMSERQLNELKRIVRENYNFDDESIDILTAVGGLFMKVALSTLIASKSVFVSELRRVFPDITEEYIDNVSPGLFNFIKLIPLANDYAFKRTMENIEGLTS